MTAAPPPLPWVASFSPRGGTPRRSLKGLLEGLRAVDPDLTEERPGAEGFWARAVAGDGRRVTERAVTMTAAGVRLAFPLTPLPNPGGDHFFEIADFGPADAASVVAAAGAVADGLDFRVTLHATAPWFINVIAERGADLGRAVAGRVGWDAATHPRDVAAWPDACRRATAAWCDHARTVRPDLKETMLATFGGPDGAAAALLRNLAALGPLAEWHEARTGASHENTAALMCGDWAVTVSFSGVPNGLLRP